MAFFKALSISASGLTAQRFVMDVIAENIANAENTRTAQGGPYRRRNVVLTESERGKMANFATYLKRSQNALSKNTGVQVAAVVEDQSPFKLVYDPTHPDADDMGYVSMPNVDTLQENVNALAASRSYDANITAFNITKSMITKALDIGRS